MPDNGGIRVLYAVIFVQCLYCHTLIKGMTQNTILSNIDNETMF